MVFFPFPFRETKGSMVFMVFMVLYVFRVVKVSMDFRVFQDFDGSPIMSKALRSHGF